MAEQKNHLGLDKFQVTVIKSNYSATVPIRKMLKTAQAKMQTADEKYQEALKAAEAKHESAVADLRSEIQAYQQQIAAIDKFTIETTTSSCGIGLSSEQCMEFIKDPQAFEDYKQRIGMGGDLFEEKKEEPAVSTSELNEY